MSYRHTDYDGMNKFAGCVMWLVIFACCLFLVTHSSICHAIAQNLLGGLSDFFWNLRARV
jgi:hypothetical protein